MQVDVQQKINTVIQDWGSKDITSLAAALCGEQAPHYRRLSDLRDLLGDGQAFPVDFTPTRKVFAADRIRELQDIPLDLRDKLLASVDPRAFRGEPEKAQSALHQMNEFLAPDGLSIYIDNGMAEIKIIGFEQSTKPDPATYSITITGLLTDHILASHVQDRFDQAEMSHDVGASLAAVIMLGSGLEGLLMGFAFDHYDALTMHSSLPADQAGKQKKLKELTLHELILFAHSVDWIESDAKDFANILRDYRNLVHPLKQISGNFSAPNTGTLQMCFPVIQQVVTDLTEALAKKSP